MINSVQPLVSVIVPCYNYGSFLKFTLESVLKQEYQNWECIIVDDGSTDNTKEIAEEFTVDDKRFAYVYQKNAGLSAARNTGVKHASGKYVQFLDSDDLIDTKKLQVQVEYMEQNERVDIMYGDSIFFDTNSDNVTNGDRRIKNLKLKVSGAGKALVRNFCVNNFIEVSSPLVKKAMLDKVGIFDTTYFTYEDWQYWFRAAVEGFHFSYAPIPGSETYIRYGHTSMLSNSKTKVRSGIQIRKYMAPFLSPASKVYNTYRLKKLITKLMLLNLRG